MIVCTSLVSFAVFSVLICSVVLFSASAGLCFVIAAFPEYLHFYLLFLILANSCLRHVQMGTGHISWRPLKCNPPESHQWLLSLLFSWNGIKSWLFMTLVNYLIIPSCHLKRKIAFFCVHSSRTAFILRGT